MDDIIRIGKISTIDYARGTASVIYTDRNNEPSPNFPFFSFAYEMPKVDDMVVVLILPNSTTKGFIMGVPWSGVKVPAQSGQGVFYKEFSDGAYIKYDAKLKQMEVSANEIILKSISSEKLTISGEIMAKTVEADTLTAESISVKKTASFQDLSVFGTATIENLKVSGTAFGHYPA